MDERLMQALQICPLQIRESVLQLAEKTGICIEELHLRAGSPATIAAEGREWRLQYAGDSLTVTQKTVEDTVTRAMEYSVYAAQEQLCRGFCTVRGGHRLGVCGDCVCEDGKITALRSFSSVNLRVAHEIRGCADALIDLLWAEPASLLLLGPPGIGKTTVLRDAVRQLSDRLHYRVGLVDERFELAACIHGQPQMDVGGATDILSGAPKAAAVSLLLRTMSPQWLAVDEITEADDVRAISEAAGCGVRLLATAHADCVDDLQNRPVYRLLTQSGCFTHAARINPDRTLTFERISPCSTSV